MLILHIIRKPFLGGICEKDAFAFYIVNDLFDLDFKI